MSSRTIVVLEGDQTGQELLEESLRVLDPQLIRVPLEFRRFDLSLRNRQASQNGVVYGAAEALRRWGLGLKAATITPPVSSGTRASIIAPVLGQSNPAVKAVAFAPNPYSPPSMNVRVDQLPSGSMYGTNSSEIAP